MVSNIPVLKLLYQLRVGLTMNIKHLENRGLNEIEVQRQMIQG